MLVLVKGKNTHLFTTFIVMKAIYRDGLLMSLVLKHNIMRVYKSILIDLV